MTAQARFGVTESIPCISRQPILRTEENVIGYELFFRESQFQNRTTTDAEQEAAAIINMLNLVGPR
jgi:c-di-GMP-related signal transduction protein